MNTPISDFLNNYENSNTLRMHMPGHKGEYSHDITEIKGADSLFEAAGIIKQSEENAAKLFGTLSTIYSCQGSTLAIHTMIALMKSENRRIIAARNSHRSFLNICALLNMKITWIYPTDNTGIIGGTININDIENALKSEKSPVCVYITSPDYLGSIADISGISQICKKYNAPLLVDNAHGSCLAFLEKSQHPIHLGADMCCDSAHKMLPAITGTAYLHINNPVYAEKAKTMMSVFSSTSPSYLMLESLDKCNRYIADNIRSDIKKSSAYISEMKKNLKDKYNFTGNEPFHITIKGIDGNYMAEKLREYNIECEYSDNSCIVLLASPINTDSEIKYLETALQNISPIYTNTHKSIDFPHLEQVITMNEAMFSKWEEISTEEAEGRICASLNVPCPPAIPIAVCGERITKECIDVYRFYGIKTVNVIK